MSRKSKKRRSGGQPRFVRLWHAMMQTPAWLDLDCYARSAYIELSRRYGGPESNNGEIPYSVREMAENLNVSQSTAIRAFKQLEAHGFIVKVKAGRYHRKRRIATEWRLTEFPCDVTDALPTKDYEKWEGPPRTAPSTMDFVHRAQAKTAA